MGVGDRWGGSVPDRKSRDHSKDFNIFGSSPILGEIFLEFFPAQKSRKYVISPMNFCRFSTDISFLLLHLTERSRSTSRRVRSEGGSQCPPVATKVRGRI
jgi:hypothetical protein